MSNNKYDAMGISPFDSKGDIVRKMNAFKNDILKGIFQAQEALRRMGEADTKTVLTLSYAAIILIDNVDESKSLLQLSDLMGDYYNLHNQIDELLYTKLGYVA